MKAPIPDISRDLFDLTGYCSIVTGASVGIGLKIAEALAYRGSDLVLVSRNAERLEEAAGKVRAIGRRAVAVAADVADDDAPERIVEAALGLGGHIDVLVNNAGFMTFADPFNVNDETWDEIFNVNVRAPMRITRAMLAEMVKACRGSVINIGRLVVDTGVRFQPGRRRSGLLLVESRPARAVAGDGQDVAPKIGCQCLHHRPDPPCQWRFANGGLVAWRS